MDNHRKPARRVGLGAGARLFLAPRGELGGRSRLSAGAWILAVLSGVLQSLIYPLPGLTFLCWVALAPLLVAILRGRVPVGGGDAQPVSAGQGFLLAYVGGVMWSFGTTYWIYHVMHIYGGLNGPTSLGLLVLFCFALGVIWGGFGLLLAILANGLLREKALFLAPFLWVPLEIVRGFPFDFPWNPLGTVLVNNIPLTRIATATGVYGLTFEIVLVNTAFAAAFLVDSKRRKMVLLAAIVVAGLLQAGELVEPPRLAADRTARLVQANIPILNADQWTPEYFQSTLRELSDLSVARGGELGPTEPAPDLVVWPESPAPFFTTSPEFRAAVSDVARRAHATMVVGSLGVSNPGQPASQLYNSAAVVAPNGDWIARYCLAINPQKVLPAPISRCSRIGPRLRAGKNVSAPTIRITPISSTVNSGVVTGNVPREGGTYFLRARLPAIASMGMIIRKRPINMVNAPAVLYQSVFVVRPAKAEPLLPACEVNE